MTESGSDSMLGSWAPPQCPFKISYSLRTLDEIRLAVMDAFFSLPRGGAEIGGILLGKREGLSIAIHDHIPLDCEHAFGPSFNLSPRDLAQLTTLLDQAQRNVPDLQPVGWYHSHTRSEIFLSDGDLEIHRKYFPNPWQIALVLKPHTFHPMRAGFFFRGRDGSYHTTESYLEFALDALPMRQVPLENAARPPETGEVRPDFAPTGRVFSLPEKPQTPPAVSRVADDWTSAPPLHTPEPPPMPPPIPAPPISAPADPVSAPASRVTEPVSDTKAAVREEPEVRTREARMSEVQTADEEVEEPVVAKQFWETEELEIDRAGLEESDIEEDEPAPRIPEVEEPEAPPAELEASPPETLEPETAQPEIEEAQPALTEAAEVETAEPEPAEPEPVPVASGPARADTLFRSIQAQPPRRGKVWALLGLAAAVALGVFGYQTRNSWLPKVWSGAAAAPAPPAVSTNLGLSLKDQDGDLKIAWDRTLPAIGAANYGTLEISGGGLPSAVRLDAGQLATGSFTYKRETERVDVALVVESAAGELGRESASFMAKLPRAGSPPTASADPALAEERDALTAQVEKLKRDLWAEIAKNQKLLNSNAGPDAAPPADPNKLQAQLNAALERVQELEKAIKPKDDQIARLRADLATQIAHNKVLGESLDAAQAQLKLQQKKRLSNQAGDTAKQ